MNSASTDMVATISRRTLIEMIDHLASAKTRLQAIHMAAYALMKDEMDAIQQLANDCDETIDLAKDELDHFLDRASGAVE